MNESQQSRDSRLAALIESLEKCKSSYSGLEGQKAALDVLLLEQIDQVQEARDLDVSYQKLQKFFQTMGTDEQVKLQKWFENVVSYGLSCVFDNYRFVITGPEVRANEIAIGFELVERIGDEDLHRDPYEECGGGVADVLAFLLQFVMIFLLRDRINPILFLDEAFKHLAQPYRPAAAALLKELVERTPVQILLITHDDIFTESADVVYRFDKPEFETIAERVK